MTSNGPCNDDRKVKIRYALRLMLLQERACLSFKEARTYLRGERFETYEILAEAFSTSVEDVREIERRAQKKVAKASEPSTSSWTTTPSSPRTGSPSTRTSRTGTEHRSLMRTVLAHVLSNTSVFASAYTAANE